MTISLNINAAVDQGPGAEVLRCDSTLSTLPFAAVFFLINSEKRIRQKVLFLVQIKSVICVFHNEKFCVPFYYVLYLFILCLNFVAGTQIWKSIHRSSRCNGLLLDDV
ncbi:unnamed protein product [Orchesella dallaii]|uniref:Uncharacterized protein n=1 Tax=Orchesella dallaii TaxID=48710 RepID=A0ABP1Q640_9HEXA